ncbi:MBL fold metallo-hydrolase [Aquabacterium sp. OR-4]|uniref:MBL fold metallo-hydrolase n=1 Tax=Aquabacterium sp. OR-4 TaxID=2978127 RepID=UPI0028C8780B|nr:MBL fold metallo-hydrolase [Aquabacterium sp. OR-4]MDT7837896.1 MBL fold metallo-hydrolase [Aquabacterium sp. OR-4]
MPAAIHTRATDPFDGLTVLERGWLSSNNLLIHPARGEAGALLVDAGHVNHAGQTLALVRQALREAPLAGIVNTHLHSDHCGGNAALQAAFGAPLRVPPGQAQQVRDWFDAAPAVGADGVGLSWDGTGQRLAPFRPDGVLPPGEPLLAGGREWQVLPAPGHDPDSVMLFDAAHGLLVSADALWEHGFGVVFPEIEGEPGFDDVGAVLEQIAALPVRWVVPGHGAPFSDVGAALARARSRLAGFQADPARHARHAVKVLLKYHLMEERAQPLAALLDWAEATPLLCSTWAQHPPRGVARARDWLLQLLHELAAAGALAVDGAMVTDRA